MSSEINKKSEKIREMFAGISPSYDFMNSLLSAGMDRFWYRKAIESLEDGADNVLDICTGTGTFAFELARKIPFVTGVDFCQEMLDFAQEKQSKNKRRKVNFIVGDALNLPFEDETFDAVTCAFGVRNAEDTKKCLREMSRVLKKNGKVIILEFGLPKNYLVKNIYMIYFKYVLPFIARIFSSDGTAYDYLVETVLEFPKDNKFVEVLNASGFRESSFTRLTFGIVNLYKGKK